MTFNLCSTQLYLFLSSFRIKNCKLWDRLPAKDFYASLDKERHFRPSKLTPKSNPNIISYQIRYSEWRNNRNRNFKDKFKALTITLEFFFRNAFVRVWWYNFSHRRALPQAWLRGARPCDHFRACEIILTWSLAPAAACRGSDISFRTRKKGLHHHLPAGLWECCCRARSLPALGSGSAPPAQRPPSCLSCEGGGCRAGNGPTPVWRHHHTSFKRTSHEVSPFLM